MSIPNDLIPTEVTDVEVLQKCKDAINKWSSKLPFSLTRKLGDESTLVSARMYHAYTLRIKTDYAQREFVLKKGGTPVRNPTPIEQVDMWNIGGADIQGEYKMPLTFTCYSETCDECGGDGKVTCPRCGGGGEEKCGNCGGRGEEKCSECGGDGEVICSACHNTTWCSDEQNRREGKAYCRRCGGSGHETCHKCGGSGTRTCHKCHGSGRVTCSKCSGRGEIKCSNCDGKGWIPYQYHLIQKQGNELVEGVWGDEGIPKLLKLSSYSDYPTTEIFHKATSGDTQIKYSEMSRHAGHFMDEVKAKWCDNYQKFDGVSDAYIHSQDVCFSCVDALVRYEYVYKEKNYVIWIDLAGGKVFETEDCGLMVEWSQQIAADGDKYAWTNPQRSIFQYAMACAITPNNKAHAKKIRGQLCWSSWLFRLAAGGVGGWLWTVFMTAQGADPLSGWYIMGAMIAIDILFAQRWFLFQVLGAGGVYGMLRYVLPYFYAGSITSDVYLQSYLASAVLMFIGSSLLFARDLSLRLRGGMIVFIITGAAVGAATAPAMYLDFSDNQELMVQMFTYAGYGICGLALFRTWARYWVQNCGWLAHKVSGWQARFSTNRLRPCFWLHLFVLAIFASAGYGWYMYVGPGVTTERKVRVAERFLKNERTRTKGMFYLEEAVKIAHPHALAYKAQCLINEEMGYPKDVKTGYALAVQASDLGDSLGWRMQGYCLEHGIGTQQELTKAHECYIKASELGDAVATERSHATKEIAKVWTSAHSKDANAQYGLALCYANGNGIERNERIARSWLSRAADAGHIKSQILICDWLIKGIGGEANPELGVSYCEKAALQDAPEAVSALGYYYFEGKVVPQDYQKAIASFMHACEKGSESAAYMLGHCYHEGLGVETNNVKSFEFYRMADERKSLPGAFALGQAYECGDGTDCDYGDALAAYTRASAVDWDDPLTSKTTADARRCRDRIAEIGKYWKLAQFKNDAEAQDKVGVCYATGNGVDKNFEQAYVWFVKSAEQNYVDGIVHLADALFEGHGVSENRNEAEKAYERAYHMGNAHATHMLAVCHEKGYGCEQNLTTAYKLYNEAADKDYNGAAEAARVIELPAKFWNDALVVTNAEAQYKLGCCFSRGNCGVDKNDQQAFKLFRLSAENGNADALYMLSLCYRDGVGTEKNPDKQRDALLAASELNHIHAEAAAGDMYRDGRLVKQDYTLSLDYYSKAIAGGLDAAKHSSNQIDRIGIYWRPAVSGDAESQFKLGLCYRDGVQTSVDEAKAKEWFEKSASQNNHDAEYALAELLSRKQPSNDATDKKIVGLLKKAVAADHLKAKTLIGKCLYIGRGIEEDYDRAIELWNEAVKAGDLDAKYELGCFHYTGRGMFNSGKDQDVALKEWTDAASAGHIESTYKLGKSYAGGSGLFSSGKDIVKAKQYLRIAANAGHRQAMADLADILEDADNATEIEEGKEWLVKFKQPIEPISIEYNTTINDTVEGLVLQVVDDDSVKASDAAKKMLEGNLNQFESANESRPLESPSGGSMSGGSERTEKD